MIRVRQKKILWMVIITLNVSIAVALVLYSLKQNINLFYTPSQLKKETIAVGKEIRVGGIVVKSSVLRNPETLEVAFSITDLVDSLQINYKGILPDLFKEGQGIIAQGYLESDGILRATQVLAKHDENYMPPEISKPIANAYKSQNL